MPMFMANPVTPIPYNYETVTASQSAVVMGTAGATGDLLYGILVVPASVHAGSIVVNDGTIAFNAFTGGTSSLADLKPFFVPINLTSANGPWKITTGASVSAVGVGLFSV